MKSWLIHAFLVAILGVASTPAQAETYVETPVLSKKKFKRDGKVRFYVYHTDTFKEVKYADAKGNWEQKAHGEISQLFRSHKDDKFHYIDVRLVEMADHLQDHFGVDTIEVISGYRSPEFNATLKEEGHKVANESYHTKGKALDIHIDELDERVIRDYLQKAMLGGVGYYGGKLMVHMDVGPVRKWQGASFSENTGVGILNRKIPDRIRTDRFYYGEKDDVRLVAHLNWNKMHLEHFFRGKWQTVPASGYSIQGMGKQAMLRFAEGWKTCGKFRVAFKGDTLWQNSNEFYRKRGYTTAK